MTAIVDPVKSKGYIPFFKTIPIFSGLSNEYLELLSSSASERRYTKGDVICKKNTYAHTVYVIKSGTVTEFAIDNNEFSSMVKIRRKLDYFGELGTLLGDSYATTVIATLSAVIISIPSEVFCKVMWDNSCAMKELLRLYRRNLQNAAQKFMSCTMFNSEGRLAYILLMMQSDIKTSKYVTITQEMLSNHCGIARQTVSTLLNNWKRCDIIDIRRGKIAIQDTNALTDILLNSAKF